MVLLLGANDLHATSVWPVTGSSGRVLCLGGSMHALRSVDYPLPSAYNRAFEASSRLVFENDPKDSAAGFREIVKSGQYPKGDNLKKHVDPRTHDYLRRFFGLLRVSEDKFITFRPWFIDMILEAPPPQLYDLGVESFLTQRAAANGKLISGLESRRGHNDVFIGLNGRDSEALLLLMFINAGSSKVGDGDAMMTAWRRGDANALEREVRAGYRDFPFLADRLLTRRNHNWLRKSGVTCVAAALVSLSSVRVTWVGKTGVARASPWPRLSNRATLVSSSANQMAHVGEALRWFASQTATSPAAAREPEFDKMFKKP